MKGKAKQREASIKQYESKKFTKIKIVSTRKMDRVGWLQQGKKISGFSKKKKKMPECHQPAIARN